MKELPKLVTTNHLRFYWPYKDSEGKSIALVARYEKPNEKKKFLQFHLNEMNEWTEGAPTPLPIFGIETLSKNEHIQRVYIF